MKKTFTKVASVLFVAIMALWTGNATAQDGCANALPLACGDIVLGSTVGASVNDGPDCITTIGTGGAHWYEFVGTGDLVDITTCNAGTTYDTKIHVYTGTCGAYTCVTGNDDIACAFAAFRSGVNFTSVAGTNYYVVVGGFGAAEGTYELSITCAAAVPGCTDGATPACNFDPAANVDDGSCEYVSCAGCTDGATPACNFDPAATLDDGSCDYSCYGCLDPLACNFSAVATIDDGSCCLDNCLTIDLVDSFGDGWNGANYTIVDGTGAIVASGTMAAGSAQTDDLCLLDGCYTITAGGGTFDGEISWTLNGVVGGPLSGVATTEPVLFQVGAGCTPGCTDPAACNFDAAADFDFGCDFLSCAGCTDPTAANFDPSATIDDGSCVFCAAGEVLAFFDMTDSFGDGWNGAVYTLTTEDGLTTISTGDLDNAQIGDGVSVGTDQFCVAPGCYILSVTDGTFPGEVGWSFSDQLGNNYGSGGPVLGQGIDFGFTGGCPFEGCTDPAANNYDPNAGVDDGSCIFPPANNDVCSAEAITCGLSVAGTTINASDNEGLIGSGCSGIDVTSPGVWYVFNAAADEQVILSTCGSAGGDTKIHVYAAAPDCNNLVCVGANDDGCAGGGFLSEIAFTAQTGNDYYILVSEFGAGVGIDFTLDATCQPCPGIPTNDDCANAIPLPTDGSSITGSICCANPSDAPNFAAGFGTAYDVFYSANSGTFDSFFFDVTNDSGSEIGLMIYDGDCNTLDDIAGCLVTGQCAGDVGDFLTLAPNTDYIFSVFTTDPAGCGDYTITVSGVIFGCTDASANNYDPTATDDDGSCDFAGVVPANDECANAEVIMCNMSYVGSTGGATATGAPTLLPCDATPGAGVWYNFTGTGDLVTLSTCGSVIDSKITVWEAADCAGPFTCVADAEDPLAFASAVDGFIPCGFFDQDDAEVQFISVAGANYYVYIAHQDVDGDPLTPDWGAFNLDVTCAPVVLGCTNPVAYNYDPAANIDDGSCDFFSDTCAGGPGTPVQFNMADSFGDGWNGAIYDITLGDGTPVATGDLDNALFTVDQDNATGADSGFDLLCLQDGCYILTIGGGTFDGEISFDIVDELGATIVSGGAGEFSFVIGAAVCGCTDPGACNFDPLATDEDGSCEFLSCAGCTDPLACNFDATATIEDGSCCFDNCLTIQMTDSFGDGWNGAVYEIYSVDGTLIASGDLDSAQDGDGASVGTDVLCLTDDCYYIVAGGGTFDGEIGWTLLGANEGPIGGGVATAEDFITFSLGAGACVSGCAEPVACNYDPAVNIPVCEACEYSSCLGCTYPDASNYDMAAGIDDGSCLFDTPNPCPEDLNEDGIVNAADLLQFLGAFGTTC